MRTNCSLRCSATLSALLPPPTADCCYLLPPPSLLGGTTLRQLPPPLSDLRNSDFPGGGIRLQTASFAHTLTLVPSLHIFRLPGKCLALIDIAAFRRPSVHDRPVPTRHLTTTYLHTPPHFAFLPAPVYSYSTLPHTACRSAGSLLPSNALSCQSVTLAPSARPRAVPVRSVCLLLGVMLTDPPAPSSSRLAPRTAARPKSILPHSRGASL